MTSTLESKMHSFKKPLSVKPLDSTQAAIVSAYTGYLVGSLDDYFAYISSLMGRPIMTHEIFMFEQEIKEKSIEDFIKLSLNSEQTNE